MRCEFENPAGLPLLQIDELRMEVCGGYKFYELERNVRCCLTRVAEYQLWRG